MCAAVQEHTFGYVYDSFRQMNCAPTTLSHSNTEWGIDTIWERFNGYS